MSEKIRPQHLARKAILYVRQSSPYRVIHNLESQKLQYAMEERLHQLGWHEIEVVDDDLGRSVAGLVTRAGFKRMVAEHRGRNEREWKELYRPGWRETRSGTTLGKGRLNHSAKDRLEPSSRPAT